MVHRILATIDLVSVRWTTAVTTHSVGTPGGEPSTMRLVAELRRAARERGGAAARSLGVADTLLNGETSGHHVYDEAQVLKDKLNATQRDHEAK